MKGLTAAAIAIRLADQIRLRNTADHMRGMGCVEMVARFAIRAAACGHQTLHRTSRCRGVGAAYRLRTNREQSRGDPCADSRISPHTRAWDQRLEHGRFLWMLRRRSGVARRADPNRDDSPLAAVARSLGAASGGCRDRSAQRTRARRSWRYCAHAGCLPARRRGPR